MRRRSDKATRSQRVCLFGQGTATQWTAALNIDSFQSNDNTGQTNNAACEQFTHDEYVNFAFIQTDGVPFPAGSPSPLGPPVSTNANTLFMNGGDELIVTLADTANGLKVTVQDVTTGQTGLRGGKWRQWICVGEVGSQWQ